MFLAKEKNPIHCPLGRSVFIMCIQWITPSIIQYVQYSVLCSRLKIVISVVSLTFSPYHFFTFSHCFPPFLRFIFFFFYLISFLNNTFAIPFLHLVLADNLKSNPGIKWQYFSSEEGIFTVFPAHKFQCKGSYEHRSR